MVWTAVVRRKLRREVDSVIFESYHDSSLAYEDFLLRTKNKENFEISEIIVMIPGRHTYIYFPENRESDA